MGKSRVKQRRLAGILVAGVLLTVAPGALVGQAGSPRSTITGGLIGTGIGVGTGLLFAHEACNSDPCITEAYVVAGAVGALLLGGSGALIGSRVGLGGIRGREAKTAALLGGMLGAAVGILLVIPSCEDECGVAGYASLGLTGAGLFGALGALMGANGAFTSSFDFGTGPVLLEPIVVPAPGRTVIGARVWM